MRRCSQILMRLNDVIDRGESPVRDEVIAQHIRTCDRCDAKVRAWDRIQEQLDTVPKRCTPNLEPGVSLASLPEQDVPVAAPGRDAVPGPVPIGPGFNIAWPAAIAALFFFAIIGVHFAVTKAPHLDLSNREPSATMENVRLVQSRQWLDRTVPVVRQTGRDVHAGVAPLGRSLRQAVAILSDGR